MSWRAKSSVSPLPPGMTTGRGGARQCREPRRGGLARGRAVRRQATGECGVIRDSWHCSFRPRRCGWNIVWVTTWECAIIFWIGCQSGGWVSTDGRWRGVPVVSGRTQRQRVRDEARFGGTAPRAIQESPPWSSPGPGSAGFRRVRRRTSAVRLPGRTMLVGGITGSWRGGRQRPWACGPGR